MREGATKLPGDHRISEEKLQVAYDAKLVLQRFTDRFHLPDSVNAAVEKGVLIVSGEAPHAWLTRVRRDGGTVPGVSKIDERNLVDLDERTYQQSKSVIESAFVYFLVNKDNLRRKASPRSRGCRMKSAAVSAPRAASGSTSRSRCAVTPTRSEAKRRIRSKPTAREAVRDFLVKCGFEPALFKVMGMGAPPKN